MIQGKAKIITPKDQRNMCPVELALMKIGGKWKAVILFHLLDDIKRFNQLQKAVSCITKSTLAKKL